MSIFKVTWWRPATVLAALALAVLALSTSGAGMAQAGGAGSITIDPAVKEIAATSGQGDVAVKIDPPTAGTSIWIVQVKYDPDVVQVVIKADQNPMCTPMETPAGTGPTFAFASSCDVKDTNGDTKMDTAVAFGGWVMNDGSTAKGFTTPQTAGTFTFKAVGASGTHSDLTIGTPCPPPPASSPAGCTTMLAPNGDTQTPATTNGLINIITSTGTSRTWGNSDCSTEAAPDNVTSRDSQAVLKFVLQKTPLSQETGCPLVGAAVTVDGVARVWGNWDCSTEASPDNVTSRDSQGVLKFVLQKTPLSQETGCPLIGAAVTVS